MHIFLSAFVALSLTCVAQEHANLEDSKGRQGTWKIWMTRNFLESEDSTIAPYYRILEYQDGKPVGPFSDFYRSGVRYREGQLVDYRDAPELHGEVKVYRETGYLSSIVNYFNGAREGVYVKYFPDGAVKMKGEFEDDKRSGEWTTFYQNGNVMSRGSYYEDQQDGKWATYYEDGRPKESIVYVMGNALDWKELLKRSNEAANALKKEQARDYVNRAQDVIDSSASGLVRARLYFTLAKVNWIEGNETLAALHLDTALSYEDPTDPSLRAEIRSGVKDLTKFCNEQYATPLLGRLVDQTIMFLERDSTISFGQAQLMIGMLQVSFVLLKQPERLTGLAHTMRSSLHTLRADRDSSYWVNLYVVWSELETQAWYYGITDAIEITSAERESIEAAHDLTGSMRATVARAQCTVCQTLSDDTDNAEDWDEKEAVLDQALEDVSAFGEQYACSILSMILSHLNMSHSASVRMKYIDRGMANCLDRAYEGRTIVYSLGEIYAMRGQCDSAAKYLNMYVDMKPPEAITEVMASSIKSIIELCQKNAASADIPSAPPLFALGNNKPHLTFDELIHKTVRRHSQPILDALAPQATSSMRLEALLLMDTLRHDPDIRAQVEAYASLSAKVRAAVPAQGSHAERGESLFRFLHDSVLVKYEESAPFHLVLENGHYNCASAVAVYSLLCLDLDLPLLYYYAPAHITCGIPQDDRVVFVELTSPKDGFGFSKEQDSLIKHLREFKLITEEELLTLGADSIYRQYMQHERKASFSSVLSAIAWNTVHRDDLFGEELSEAQYDRFVTSIVLDSCSYGIELLPAIGLLAANPTLARLFLHDLQYLSSFVARDTSAYMWLVSAGVIPLMYLTSTERDFDPVPYCQSIHDNAPPQANAPQVHDVIDASCALAYSSAASLSGDLERAFSYVYDYIPSEDWVSIESNLTTFSRYVDALIAQEELLRAMKIGESLYQKTNASTFAPIYYDAVFYYISSTASRTMLAAQFRELCSAAMNLWIKDTRDPDDQYHILWWLVENVTFNTRLDLARIVCEEARTAGASTSEIDKISSIIGMMEVNHEAAPVAKDLTYNAALRIGSQNGPTTSTLIGGGGTPYVTVDIKGLEMGQSLTISAQIKYAGGPAFPPATLTFCATDAAMSVWIPLIPPVKRNTGKGVVTLQADEFELEPIHFTVR